jgi:hypothetical protein
MCWERFSGSFVSENNRTKQADNKKSIKALSALLDGPFNTLAQSGTANNYQPAVIIQGKGSELGNGDTIKGRAKRKFLDQNLSLHLVDMAARNDQPEMVQSYWNTHHCQNSVYSKDRRLYGQYCKNRNCTLCVASVRLT